MPTFTASFRIALIADDEDDAQDQFEFLAKRIERDLAADAVTYDEDLEESTDAEDL